MQWCTNSFHMTSQNPNSALTEINEDLSLAESCAQRVYALSTARFHCLTSAIATNARVYCLYVPNHCLCDLEIAEV